MKRKAQDGDGAGAGAVKSSPNKKIRLGELGKSLENTPFSPFSPFSIYACFSDSLVPTQDPDDHIKSEADDDFSDRASQVSQSASTQPTTLTQLSSRRKFPSELKTIKCTYPGCDKAYNRPARLAAHFRSHTNDRPFKCTYPEGSHSAERKYSCAAPDCGKSFLTATRLRRHQAVHEGQERYRCRDFPPCNQTFRKHQTLQRHIRSEHLHVAAFQCTQKDPQTGITCGAGFDTAATLRRHEEREHGELRFWCDECVKHVDEHGNPKRTGFPTAWLLQNHIKQVHANCMFCGLSCNGREELEQHIEEWHSKQSLEGRKNVSCTWPGCGKTFTKKSNLYAHVRQVHEGVRFVCGAVDLSGTEDLAAWPQSDGCGEGFATKASLENHVRYVHLKYTRPQGQGSWMDNTWNGSSGPTLLQELTGVGGSSRRTVPCTVPGCTQKFHNASDRETHLRSQHAVGQDGPAGLSLIPELNAEAPPPSDMPLDPSLGLDPAQYQNLTSPDEFQDLFRLDGDEPFWFGADVGPAPAHATGAPPLPLPFDDEWRRDEAEMRQLIDAGEGIESLIDPALT